MRGRPATLLPTLGIVALVAYFATSGVVAQTALRGSLALGVAALAAGTAVLVLFRIAQLSRASSASEERFHDLVRSIDAMVWECTLDPERYTYISPRTADLLGWPLERLLEDGFWASLIHADDRELVASTRTQAAEGDGTYEYEYRVRTGDGRWLWLRVLGRIENGHARGVSFDVTEQHLARLGAEQSLSLLRATVEATQDGILVTDPEGRITIYNRRYLEIFGHSEEDMQLELVPRTRKISQRMRNPEEFIAIANTYFADPEREGFDVVELADGRIVERVTGPQQTNGTILGRVWSFRDVTEQRLAERERFESQRRLQESLEKMSLVAVAVDLGGRVTFCNDALLELSGYTREEVLGRSWLDVFPAPDRETAMRHAEYLTRIREDEELPPWENLLWLPSGEARLLVWHETALRDPDGKPAGSLGLGEDVTERRRAEQALRESEERFRTVFEASPHGMNVVSVDGRMLESNEALERMLGYTKAELAGRSFQELTHPDDVAADLALFRELVAGERESYQLEKRYLRADGGVLWVRLTSFGLRDASDRPGFAIGLLEDITERKELEEQLRHAHKLEAVGRLAGGIAHDFNNLLTAITGYAEFLRRGLPDGPLRDDAEEIERAAARAAGLTRQLLAFSRRQVLQPKVLDLNELVAELERMLERLIGEDVRLDVSLEPGLARVEADPGQLEQVIVNLAVNARDAMPLGGSLRIATASAGDRVRLTVEDTGVGMDEETRSHLFEPFFTTKEQGKGTGLGLATVYGIVRQSNGEISVESAPGAGTRFEIDLPAVSEPCVDTEPPAGATRTGSRGSETVLLVEDEPVVRELVFSVLRNEGYTVLEAAGAELALEIAERYGDPIDLVVTDVVMPHMSGRELAERMRTVRPKTRVLYTSGYDESAIRNHGLEHDEHSFLAKPFTPETLTRRVREVLDAA